MSSRRQSGDFGNGHARGNNWNIKLKEQTPNSPDINTCDLGFFRALQAAQWKHSVAANNIDGLIAQVTQAWNSFEPQKLDKNFVTLQGCLDEIIQLDGDNNYKIPHMDKDGILRLHGRLSQRGSSEKQSFGRARR